MTETSIRSEPSVGTETLDGVAGAAETARTAEESVTPGPLVSIVVPYYNPGDRLRSTIEHLWRVLNGLGMPFEIIAVSDGSTDGSQLTLDGFREDDVRRVSYSPNVGKGHALRIGLAMSSGRYVGFIDADGDISPEFLAGFIAALQSEEPDIVIGSKRHADSSVNAAPLRRLYSWTHQAIVRRLFRLDVRDTQVGIKLMERRVLEDVLPLLREDCFALDLELLVLARRFGHTRILEAPVRIDQRQDSTISVKRAWRLLLDTFGIYVRLCVRHHDGDAISSWPRLDAPAPSEPMVAVAPTSAAA